MLDFLKEDKYKPPNVANTLTWVISRILSQQSYSCTSMDGRKVKINGGLGDKSIYLIHV
jgi:hypothetical protein